MHQSKEQSTTALSLTEAKLTAAAVTAANDVEHMRSTLQESGLPMEDPTLMCGDNQLALEMINNADKPTGQSGHMDIRFFAIQGRKEDGHVTTKHTPGIISPVDDLTEPLGCVPHTGHARHMMGHCKKQTNNPQFGVIPTKLSEG